MTLNIGKLELQLAKKIAESTCNSDLNLLAAAIKQIRSNAVWSVPSASSLPTNASAGELAYVENERSLYFLHPTAGWSDLSLSGGSLTKLSLWGECITCTSSGASNPPASSTAGCFYDVVGGGTTWCLVQTAESASGGVPFAAGIKTDGTLWTWGRGDCGQLGNSTGGFGITSSSPGTTSGGGTNWCTVSAITTVAAIKTDGTLWTWGWNANGALGYGGSFATCRTSPGTTAGGGTNWVRVSVGDRFGVGIKTDGTLWTWGWAASGRLANGSTTGSRLSPATASGGGTNWCVSSSGYNHTLALKTDGTLWVWGGNTAGQLGIGIGGYNYRQTSPVTTSGGGSDWCFVNAGNNQSAGIKTNGTLWTWGVNTAGLLGEGTTSSRVSPGTVVGGGTNWCAAGTGSDAMAAIKTDGTLWTWGCNSFGQLATGNNVCRSSPGTTISAATDWWRVSGGRPFAGLRRIQL